MKPSSMTVLASMVCLAASAAQANTYIVTKTADTFDGVCDSDCSLREAVQAANQHPGPDEIHLAAGTYTLARPDLRDDGVPCNDPGDPCDEAPDEDNNVTGDLDVTDSLRIVGAGSAVTVIDGGRRSFLVPGNGRLFEVFAGVTFDVSSLTLAHGYSIRAGGAIETSGVTTLTNVAISGNNASSSQQSNPGGGIANYGSLTLIHCQVEGNSVLNGESGSGLGGGIYNTGTLYVYRSLIAGNSTSDDDDAGFGGGVFNGPAGSAVIERSLLTSNSRSTAPIPGGDAVYNEGQMTIINTTISGNRPGGADGSGAVANAPGGNLTLRYVTIANNGGGGLYNSGSVSLNGALIAGNPRQLDVAPEDLDFHSGLNCFTNGSYTATNSLLGLDGNCTAQIYVDNGTVFTTQLEPLRLSGGVTATHTLRRSSPAVDAVNPYSAAGACETTDQRSAPRPPVDDGRRGRYCDIGAYELRQ